MRKNIAHIAVFAFVGLIGGCGHSAYSPVYYVEAVAARVLDADTGLPVEGANVVAVYETSRVAGFGGSRTGRVLEVAETVTDAQGRFSFPAVTLFNSSFDDGLEADKSPDLTIFKPGYIPGGGIRRDIGAFPVIENVPRDALKLKRYSHANLYPEPKPYPGWKASMYSDGSIDRLILGCWWDKIPKTLVAMDAERQRATALHPEVLISLITLSYAESWCKSPRMPTRSAAEFLRSHTK